MTIEEANKQIAELSNELNATIEKGWVCGETKMPLTDEHRTRLIAQAQAKADAIAREVVQ